jgi:hypothetical protein
MPIRRKIKRSERNDIKMMERGKITPAVMGSHILQELMVTLHSKCVSCFSSLLM